MLGKRRRPHGHGASATPMKRRRGPVLEEITFDAEARKEFLTGFHRRKVQRQKRAQELAAQKEKEERRRQRAQARTERQEYLRQHAAAMQAVEGTVMNGADDESAAEGSVVGPVNEESIVGAAAGNGKDLRYRAGAGQAVDAQREYEDDEDDDLAATVTIEAVDVTREGLRKRGEADADLLGVGHGQNGVRETVAKSALKTKPKKKKKQFRYESKAERQANRFKEHASSKARRKAKQKD